MKKKYKCEGKQKGHLEYFLNALLTKFNFKYLRF